MTETIDDSFRKKEPIISQTSSHHQHRLIKHYNMYPPEDQTDFDNADKGWKPCIIASSVEPSRMIWDNVVHRFVFNDDYLGDVLIPPCGDSRNSAQDRVYMLWLTQRITMTVVSSKFVGSIFRIVSSDIRLFSQNSQTLLS